MRWKPVVACISLLAGAIVVLPGTPVAAAPTRYEAESSPATCDGTIDSNHAGYSGTGFCNGANAVGAAAQFTVNASASGTATLGVRFANGTTSSRPADVIVNGSTAQSVSFEGTGAWSTWATKTLTVQVTSGSNTIRFNPTNSAGLPNVDYLEFEVITQPSRLEAENSPATCDGTIDSNHAGYSGTGFCNGANAVGAGAQFTVNAPASGTATLRLRFANGSTSSRPADVIVNGSTAQSVSFEGTGAWSTWATKTLTVQVTSGSNTIRFNPTNSAGLPNVDYLEFEVMAGPGPGDPMSIVAAMQPGWNLGNSLDATGPDETSWGNPRITQELINSIKAQGFKSIRIPVTWGQHQGGAPSYTVEAAYMNRVKEVVGWALAADLYVLINVHHDSWQWVNTMPTDRTNVLNRFNALWTQIAGAFRDSSPKLLFESINEPQFSGGSVAEQEQMLRDLNVSFRNIVRQSGGNNGTRLLVLPSMHTSDEQARLDALLTTINAMNDPNLAATFHFYGFWPFSVNIAGYTRYNAEVQNDLITRFDRVANTLIARGIPVILGEYGLLGFDRSIGTIEQGEKLKYFEFLGYYARTKKITTQLWDNGQHFGRTSLQWNDPELSGQFKSSWTVRSGTASADFVYNARSSSISSKTITLNHNGASFVAVRQGSTNLAPGSDYTVSGDQLTFTASALTRLSGTRGYGTNASVHVVFSQGVPWRVDIRTYDAPILSNASGSTGSFAIPTQFRGDQLATMEAKYSDGSNAGPQNWTSFKEFDYNFLPNYSGGTISLKPEFFSEVDDNRRVTLTFHFWSGTQVTYYVTKSGGSVTGTTN